MEYKLARDRMVSRYKVKKKGTISLIHYHEEYELYYMLNGNTTYFIGDEIYSIEKGNFVFIPKGIPHNTESKNCMNNERILLSFSEKIFNTISEGYLSRKFKAVSGIGINQYITYVRISNAEKLLRESDFSVTEIAEKCGFNGSNYFTSVFKKIKGATPLVYRKQNKAARN